MRDRHYLQLLVLMAVLCQGSRTWRKLQLPSRPLPPADPVSRYWQRFAAVRQRLERLTAESRTPGGEAWQHLGYLGDAPRQDQLPDLGRDAGTGLFLAQHALLPHLLIPGDTHARILGNFHDDAARRAALARPELRLEEDFGDGVLLLLLRQ